jgi:tetratricopeptide (TPR) repeat protein
MVLTINQALQKAASALKADKLQDAERIYLAVLKSQPGQPDANHNLGVLALSSNNIDAAIPYFKAALDANAKVEQFWLSYINALMVKKDFKAAKQVLESGRNFGLAGDKVNELEKQLLSNGVNQGNNDQSSDELSLAVEFRETGKLREAQDWLIKFIESHPNNASAYSLLCHVLLLDNQVVKAQQALSTAILLDSELISNFRNQARILLKQSDPQEALKKAQIGYTRSKNDLESALVLASCLNANQRNQEALELINDILLRKPNYAEAYVARALTRLDSKDVVGAIVDASEAVSIKPHLSQIWSLLGSLHFKNRNLSKAIKALQKVHELQPNDVACMVNLGNLLTLDKRGLESIDIFEKATVLAPIDINILLSLGSAYQQSKKPNEAESIYRKALAINPKSTETLSRLSSIAKETGDCISAVRYLKNVIEIAPSDAEAHNNLGILQLDLGRLEEAEGSYNQAIALNPDYANAHYNLGNMLKGLGKLEAAEASYLKAIRLKPKLAEAHYNLGLISQERGRSRYAELSYRRAIELTPDFSEAHNNLGITLKELGRLDEAEECYKRALAKKPRYAEAYYNLGVTLDALGRLNEAEDSYKAAIASMPGFTLAHERLLRSYYLSDRQPLFFDKLDFLISKKVTNASIGSLTCRSALKYGVEKRNLFCTDPLQYVSHVNMNIQYDFKKVFVEKAELLLNEKNISNRRQPLLFNGAQTSGNVFDIKNSFTDKIQEAILLEIEKYRNKFKDGEDGFISKWPEKHNLYGWLICMESGGKLKPHIHENGWLSGSLYINVPKKTKAESGNLVVSLGEEEDEGDNRINQKQIVNVVTGSLVLFPASLTHYTIPFEAKEKRIVLAFDLKKIARQ